MSGWTAEELAIATGAGWCRPIGGGRTSLVFEMGGEEFSDRYAFKLLRERYLGYPKACEAFVRAAQQAACIDHPSVERVISFGHCPDGAPFMVAEFTEGVPLLNHLTTVKSNWQDRIGLLRQAAEALQAVHEAGVVHGGVSAEHFTVRDDGSLVLRNIGLTNVRNTVQVAHGNTRMHDLRRQASYVAPELVMGRGPNELTDIYAFGVLVYEVLTGLLPFLGEDVFETLDLAAQGTYVAPSRHRDLPRLFDHIVLGCLAPEGRRFDSIAQVIELLDSLIEEPRDQPTRKPRRGPEPEHTVVLSGHLMGYRRQETVVLGALGVEPNSQPEATIVLDLQALAG